MKGFICIVILCAWAGAASLCSGQNRIVLRGTVYDAGSRTPLSGAFLSLNRGSAVISGTAADSAGYFYLAADSAGNYILQVSSMGFLPYRDSIRADGDHTRSIYLEPNNTLLDEVQIIEKINPVTQRNDTTEYDARAFKVHSGAEAWDLVRKMPGMDLSGKQVRANGESVTRLLIDGKPFFANDPDAALKNFPAHVIRSVQVYKEQGEQEQFTGFRNGPGTTTINIVTRPDKRQGKFGKIAAGLGNGDVYAGKGNINLFDSNRRITALFQSNNNSTQNFSDASVYESSRGNGSNGAFNISNLALNYWSKWGTRTELSGNVTAGLSTSKLQQESWRQYILATDSGRQYRENNITNSRTCNYRFDLKLNHRIDTFTSLIIQQVFSVVQTRNATGLSAVTLENGLPVNRFGNQISLSGDLWNLSNDILLKRKFRKKGRSLSLKINTGIRENRQRNTLEAENLSYGSSIGNDTLNQHSPSLQSDRDISLNTAYTEPLGKKTSLQVQYRVSYDENSMEKQVYDLSHQPHSTDSLLSVGFVNRVSRQKAGMDFKHHGARAEFAAGIYGQYSSFVHNSSLPAPSVLSYRFQNILPQANIQYRLSPAANLQLSYTTSVATPTAAQIQNNINNANQYYLQTGNPSLRPAYRHNLNLSCLFTNTQAHSSLNISAGASGAGNYISNEVIIATADTLIGSVKLYKGGQLSRPVNLEGYRSFNSSINYALPLGMLKSNLSVTLSGSLTRIPALINHQINYSLRQHISTGINLSSNISETLDYTLTSTTSYGYNTNTLHTAYTSRYFSQDAGLTVQITLLKRIMLGTSLHYQYSNGISTAVMRNNLLCYASLATRICKQQGCIRLSFYDLLNQNNNIQYIVTDTYISSVRSSALQRYAALSFTWSFNRFR